MTAAPIARSESPIARGGDDVDLVADLDRTVRGLASSSGIDMTRFGVAAPKSPTADTANGSPGCTVRVATSSPDATRSNGTSSAAKPVSAGTSSLDTRSA